MSPEEVKRLLPGNRILLGDLPGKVKSIGYGQRPDDGEHFVRVEVELDGGGGGTVSGSMISELHNASAWQGLIG